MVLRANLVSCLLAGVVVSDDVFRLLVHNLKTEDVGQGHVCVLNNAGWV